MNTPTINESNLSTGKTARDLSTEIQAACGAYEHLVGYWPSSIEVNIFEWLKMHSLGVDCSDTRIRRASMYLVVNKGSKKEIAIPLHSTVILTDDRWFWLVP